MSSRPALPSAEEIGALVPIGRIAKETPYSADFLRQLARSGKIRAFKLNRDWLTIPDAIRDYLKSQTKRHEKALVVLQAAEKAFMALALTLIVFSATPQARAQSLSNPPPRATSAMSAVLHNVEAIWQQFADFYGQQFSIIGSQYNRVLMSFGQALLGKTTDEYLADSSSAIVAVAKHPINPRGPETATAMSAIPQVLGISTTTPAPAENPTALATQTTSSVQSLINTSLQEMLAKGLLTGPAGPEGPAGPQGDSSDSGVINNGNGQTTAAIADEPIVSYYPSDTANNFDGASVAGFTQLSAQDFNAQAAVLSGSLTTQTANIQSALTVQGSASIAGNINFSGNLYQNGSLFSAGSSSPWTTLGSNVYYNIGNVGIGTTTPGSPLVVAGTSLFTATSTFLGNLAVGTTATGSQPYLLMNAATGVLTINGDNPSSGGAKVQTGLLHVQYYSGNSVSNVVLEATSAGAPDLRLQVDAVTSHIGLNLGGTSYSAFTVQRNLINGPASFQLRGPTFESTGSGNMTNWQQDDTSLQIQPVNNTIWQTGYATGTNPQTYSLCNTFTDYSDYECLRSTWATNTAQFTTVASGTGILRPLSFGTGTTGQWQVATSGNLLATTDNAYDIGASGANRPRNAYIGGSLTAAGAILQNNLSVGTTSTVTTLNLQGSGSSDVLDISSSTGASMFHIAANGNIGIGTTSPATFLELDASSAGGIWVNTFRNSSFGGNLRLTHARGTQTAPLPLSANDDAGDIYFNGIQSNGSNQILGNIEGVYLSDNRGAIRFLINNTPDYVMGMATNGSALNAVGIGYSVAQIASSTGGRLFVNGSLGIGTTTPNQSLSVQGSGTTDLLDIASSSGATDFYVASGGNVGIGTTSPSYLLYVGSASVASGTVAQFQNVNGTCAINPTMNTLACSSDERLKKDITPMGDALNQVMQLQPVYFNWNAEASGTPEHPGFIAQQVQQIMPEVVSTDPNTGLLSIGYSDLVPAVVSAMQQMQSEIATLQGGLNGNATTSNLTVYSPGNFSGDSVGQAEILTGQTSVRITFTQAYTEQPIITATPVGAPALADGFRYTLENIDASGFTIQTLRPVTQDTTFDWHSFGSPAEQLTVSDGSTSPIPLILPPSPQSAAPAIAVTSDASTTTTPAISSVASSTADSTASSTAPAVLGASTGTLSPTPSPTATPIPSPTVTPTPVPTPTPASVTPTPTPDLVTSQSPSPTPTPTAAPTPTPSETSSPAPTPQPTPPSPTPTPGIGQ